MKISNENKSRIIILGIICIVFFVILTFVSIFLENKLEISEKTKSDDMIYSKHIAMISEEPTEEFWMSIYEGAKDEGKKQGMYIENFGEGIVEDYKLEELFDMAVAAKVDGIILQADAGDTLADHIERAAKENIPVMTILSDVPNSARISFVSGNDYATGEMYGDEIIEEVKEKWNAEKRKVKVTVLVDSNREKATPNLIYSGIHVATASVENKMELSTDIIDNTGKFESEETVRNLLLSPEPPDIIVCLSAIDTISTYQSVIEYNRVGQTSIIGYYSSKDTVEGIQKGIIKSSVLINAKELGETAIEGMREYLEKKYVNEYLTVSPTLIVGNNVEDYIEKDE